MLFTLTLVLLAATLPAQDVSYSFGGVTQTTEGGVTYYETDVVASSAAGFLLGAGHLYLDYNTDAFGENAVAAGKLEFLLPTAEYVLAQRVGSPPFVFDLYDNVTVADNTAARASVAWSAAYSEECLAQDNVTSAPTKLFRLRFTYADAAQDPGLCFTSSNPFRQNTFTAYSAGSCAASVRSGDWIRNDQFDCQQVVLPVELLTFSARRGEKTARLDWVTATEESTAYFAVEHSADGLRFNEVGRVAAAGDSQNETVYDFAHAEPLAGCNYYRLRMVDLDESFEYSRVVVLEWTEAVAGPVVTPNPSAGQFSVNLFDLAGPLSLALYNAQGTRVRAEKIGAGTSAWQHEEQLPRGVYLLVVEGAARSWQRRVVVQ